MKGTGTMRTTRAEVQTHTTEQEETRPNVYNQTQLQERNLRRVVCDLNHLSARTLKLRRPPLSNMESPCSSSRLFIASNSRCNNLSRWRQMVDVCHYREPKLNTANASPISLHSSQPALKLFNVLFFLVCTMLSGVRADQNVTVDDQNPLITYFPQGAWTLSANSSLDIGGAHMLTQNPNGTAVFNFTGIAVYYLSPLWPYTVNTAISLDSGNATLVDLVDHTRTSPNQGPETVQSQVVWSATGLNNGPHVLTMFVGVGQPFGVVDAIIYTNTNPPLPSSVQPSTTDRIIASSTSSPNISSKSKNVVPIALGTIFGLLGLLLLLLGIWFFFRNKRKKRPISEWTVDGTSYSGGGDNGPSGRYVYPTPSHPQGKGGYNIDQSGGYYGNGYGNRSGHGYPMEQTSQGTFQNTRYANVGMPAPSIPAQDVSRSPNRYVPGYALSTITEKSTPRMADGGLRTPVGVGAYSPASVMTGGSSLPGPPTDMGEYYAASPSMGSTAVMSVDEHGANPGATWNGNSNYRRAAEQRPTGSKPRHYQKPVGNYL